MDYDFEQGGYWVSFFEYTTYRSMAIANPQGEIVHSEQRYTCKESGAYPFECFVEDAEEVIKGLPVL